MHNERHLCSVCTSILHLSTASSLSAAAPYFLCKEMWPLHLFPSQSLCHMILFHGAAVPRRDFSLTRSFWSFGWYLTAAAVSCSGRGSTPVHKYCCTAAVLRFLFCVLAHVIQQIMQEIMIYVLYTNICTIENYKITGYELLLLYLTNCCCLLLRWRLAAVNINCVYSSSNM